MSDASSVTRPRCPRCRVSDLHHMRAPNPEPPRIVYHGTGDVTHMRDAAGRVVATHVDGDAYDRPDERQYDVVRVCRSCGHAWGQTVRSAP